MSIPEAAVEAAARALYEAKYEYNDWEEAKSPETWITYARATLEAAAPILVESLASEAFKDKKIQGLQRVLIGNWLRGRV